MIMLLGLLVAAPAAFGAPVRVTGVEFLPNKSVSVPFASQKNAPQAELNADVQFKHGQSRIKLNYKDLKPAILFGGDVTSYVLWAVTADGRATNLGEVQQNGKASGTETFYVGLKGFAMLVTAEPYFMVARPSAMVMFVGGPPKKEKSRSASYTFVGLAMAPRHDVNNIDELHWDSKQSLLLRQAQKAYEMATRYEARTYAGAAYEMAGSELEAAEAAAAKRSGSKELDNSARNAVQLCNTAINIAVRKIAAGEIATVIAMRQAQLDASEERSETAEMMVAVLSSQQAQMSATLEEAESVNIELQTLLLDALSTIAEARVEAAMIVLTLPGILFGTDEATLKPEAEMGLAKLSGILMVFHRATVAIGGYTDVTGDTDYNVKLSGRRAESVMNLLTEQGVAPGRVTAAGYGAADPVADNSTQAGRAANRRVEMIITVAN
jgi:outer membrane protein OmpA-like peptidoglycan-associated protein